MIIKVIDQLDVACAKAKDQPPVARHIDRPVAGIFALQRVKSIAWLVHITWTLGLFQKRQKANQSNCMILTYPGCIAPKVQRSQAFVPEACDHWNSV